MLYTVYIVVTGRQSIVAATVYTGKPSLTSITAEQNRAEHACLTVLNNFLLIKRVDDVYPLGHHQWDD